MLGHRRDYSAFLLACILDTLIPSEAIKRTRGCSWFHTGWGGWRAALSQHYFLSPFSYWNGDHKRKGRPRNWGWQNLERKSEGKSTWRMAKAHPWAGVIKGTRSICDNTRHKRNNCSRLPRSQTRGSLPKSLALPSGEARKRERLLSGGCLPRTTVQLCRGERCFPFLNTCWGCLWSLQACGILLPFLCCLDCLYLSSCILPQIGSGTALDFYNWTAESLHFLPSQGTKLTEVPLSSQRPPEAECSGFWRWPFLCFLRGSFSGQPVRRMLSLGGCSFGKCLRLA